MVQVLIYMVQVLLNYGTDDNLLWCRCSFLWCRCFSIVVQVLLYNFAGTLKYGSGTMVQVLRCSPTVKQVFLS